MQDRNKQIVEAAKRRNITVISTEGSEYGISPELYDVMCLTSDMTLFVITGQLSNMDVLAYQDRLRRRNVKIGKVREAPVQLLRAFYRDLVDKSDARISTSSSTSAQSEAVRIISDAVRRDASDIHIAVHKGSHGTISYRVHGDLYKIQEPPASKCEEMCSTIYQSMCSVADSIYKPATHQDARMSEEFVERCGLFGARIASGPTDNGSMMVIRLLYDSGSSIPTLEQLGYLPEQINQIYTMSRQTSGINILSGATGSGKSTTLTSVLTQIINRARSTKVTNLENESEEYWGIHVITIEDPPEYKIRGANQTPLLADKSDEESIRRGWSKAISACMRMDPDIMMIGEMRDHGSAIAAFDAAMTGHGVWTTVHTTDAVGVMLRLRGLGVEEDRMLNPEIVTGLINQSLAQRLCPKCSIPWREIEHEMDKGLRERVEHYCDVDAVRVRGKGCSECSHGIVGRIVVAEVITPNLEFMRIFNADGQANAKAHWITVMGGMTKCMALIRRINEGLIDPREGESKISALDKDKNMLNIDYSHYGDFELGKQAIKARREDMATLPKLDDVQPSTVINEDEDIKVGSI